MKEKELRIALLKLMNNYIIEIGDEDIYDVWFREGVPDECDEELYDFIASRPKNFIDCCKCFAGCVAMEDEYFIED